MLKTTGSGHNIIINKVIGTTAHSATLTSAGNITEGANGSVHAEFLTGPSAGAATLTGANDILALSAFTSGPVHR